jgi:hypothetical protein
MTASGSRCRLPVEEAVGAVVEAEVEAEVVEAGAEEAGGG